MKNNKGFSLVELIVVIAIMAVLVGVLAPTLLRYVEKSRVQKDESAVSEVVQAVKIALADEKIVAQLNDGDSVTVSNGRITAPDAASLLAAELNATIGANKPALTSKAYGTQTYTIHITGGADGLVCDDYASTNWSAGSGSGSTPSSSVTGD